MYRCRRPAPSLLFEVLQPALRARLHHRHQQSPFDGMTGVSGPERLTGALLDRLTHHVHISK